MKWPVDTCPPQKVAQSTSRYYFVLQNPVLLRTTKLAQSTSQYYFPVLLRTTKLAQSTSQYYFVLQSLHKVLPSTTSYYKTCTKYVPVVLHTQSLHKVLPSTTSYYKACTKYVPVLLRTTKLAQSTSQYYFPVLLPSTTSQYYFPVLLRTTKLAQSTSQYYFVLQTALTMRFVQHNLHKVRPSTTLHLVTLWAALTMRFAARFAARHVESTAPCHEKCRRISPKCPSCHDKMNPEVSRWCESIAPATQNRRGHAEKTRFGAISHSRDKAISVLPRKRKLQEGWVLQLPP